MIDRIEILQELTCRPIAMERLAAENMVARLQSPEANQMLAAISGRDVAMIEGREGMAAVIPVQGMILHKGHLPPLATATTAIARAIDEAVAEPRVKRIILNIDSPGGTVTGVPELAAQIRRARKRKPISAIANGLAASAAYWIGSAASEFVVIPSGSVGSIGVLILHLDQSARLDQMGVKPTFISAGKHKTDGNSLQPLNDDARSEFQKGVDRTYRDFLAAVATGRGVSVSTVEANFGQGRTVDAREALKAGMVDRIATLSETLLRGGIGRGSLADIKGVKARRDRLAGLIELGAYDGADLIAARRDLAEAKAEVLKLESMT